MTTSDMIVNRWLSLGVLLLCVIVIYVMGTELTEMRATATRCLSTVKYLVNDRQDWMNSYNRLVDTSLKLCKGDFSVCPNGVRGIIEDEPGEVTPFVGPQCGHGSAKCDKNGCWAACTK